ncbi:hypothetical protein PLICRDRAFT_41732 [Plicaturopsis crispa FD-325 SS-3]|nr:hypothetical protein PLICRDRAFT_41732 [Plicaturopsis crispa FD-325 SS-3]
MEQLYPHSNFQSNRATPVSNSRDAPHTLPSWTALSTPESEDELEDDDPCAATMAPSHSSLQHGVQATSTQKHSKAHLHASSSSSTPRPRYVFDGVVVPSRTVSRGHYSRSNHATRHHHSSSSLKPASYPAFLMSAPNSPHDNISTQQFPLSSESGIHEPIPSETVARRASSSASSFSIAASESTDGPAPKTRTTFEGVLALNRPSGTPIDTQLRDAPSLASTLTSAFEHNSAVTAPIGIYGPAFRHAARGQRYKLAQFHGPRGEGRRSASAEAEHSSREDVRLPARKRYTRPVSDADGPDLATAHEIARGRYTRRLGEEEEIDRELDAQPITSGDTVLPLESKSRPWNVRFLLDGRVCKFEDRTIEDDDKQPGELCRGVRSARRDGGRAAMFTHRLEEMFGPGDVWRGAGSKPSKARHAHTLGKANHELHKDASGSESDTSAGSSAGEEDEADEGGRLGKRVREGSGEPGRKKRIKLDAVGESSAQSLAERVDTWEATLRTLVKGKVRMTPDALEEISNTLTEIDNDMEHLTESTLKESRLLETLTQLSKLETIGQHDLHRLRRRAGRIAQPLPSVSDSE